MFKHPKEMGETYLQHGKVACKISFHYFKCGITMLIHAILPDLPIPKQYCVEGSIDWLSATKENRGN